MKTKLHTITKRSKPLLKRFVLCIFALFLIAGCDDFLNYDPNTITKTVIGTIPPAWVEIVSTMSPSHPMYDPDWSETKLYMELTDEKTNRKYGLTPGQIEGFTYKKGYKYRIKVRISYYNGEHVDPCFNCNEGYFIETPPGYSFEGAGSFKLIKVLSKIKVDK